MARTLFRFLPLAILGALAAGVGCTSSNTAVIAGPSPPIADVPIPAGFRMADDSQTFLVPNQVRIAHHHYKGTDNYLSVAKFYREQTPLKGWELLSEQQNGGTVLLNFSKGGEDLSVTVVEGTIYTHVYVRLDPNNRGNGVAPPH